MQSETILASDFFDSPSHVCSYAIDELKNNSYLPYGPTDWLATRFKQWHECPFKSSHSLISALSDITGEQVDLDHWRLSYPEHGSTADKVASSSKSCKWNCTFHFKPITSQKLGDGVHNHVTDVWNGVGEDDWVGLIYLNTHAPIDTAL